MLRLLSSKGTVFVLRNAPAIRAIWSPLARSWSTSVQHTYREGNACVDWSANVACSFLVVLHKLIFFLSTWTWFALFSIDSLVQSRCGGAPPQRVPRLPVLTRLNRLNRTNPLYVAHSSVCHHPIPACPPSITAVSYDLSRQFLPDNIHPTSIIQSSRYGCRVQDDSNPMHRGGVSLHGVSSQVDIHQLRHDQARQRQLWRSEAQAMLATTSAQVHSRLWASWKVSGSWGREGTGCLREVCVTWQFNQWSEKCIINIFKLFHWQCK